MSIQKLERVMWRIRDKNKRVGAGDWVIHKRELMRAIMIECGTSEATYTRTKWALTQLGWIKKINMEYVALTGKDLQGDY